jgi:SHS2 domain-containing protein
VTYRWVDHTAELELHVEAPTPEQVLRDALQALSELFDGGSGEPETRNVDLDAPDLAALLVRWLEELVFLADAEGFVPNDADVELRESRLRATLRGRSSATRPLVKAVTYHGLEFEPDGDGWHARVVLDV